MFARREIASKRRYETIIRTCRTCGDFEHLSVISHVFFCAKDCTKKEKDKWQT